MTKEACPVDIDDCIYGIECRKSTFMALRHVPIDDLETMVNGYVDHFGGVYEITNPTRVHTEAILAGAPVQTGDNSIDKENLQGTTSMMCSLADVAKLYDMEGDVRFPDVMAIVNIYDAANQYCMWMGKKRMYSLNYSYEDEKETHELIEQLRDIMGPVAERTKEFLRNEHNIKIDSGNAFVFKLDLSRRQSSSLSLVETRSALERSVGTDGTFRFD